MSGYFIKSTIIWTILLLVYVSAFSKSTDFRANRMYLLLGLLAGAILPLLPSPWHFGATSTIGQITDSRYLHYVPAGTPAAAGQSTGIDGPDWDKVLFGLYIAGAGILLARSLTEVTRILRKAIYGQYVTINGFRVFKSKKIHAPFSFMGWIFITDTDNYTREELSYILQHEYAHNQRGHWADIIFAQLCCIVFWVNPAVWAFRHLLKMQHEFEADSFAAADNRYGYGHFLLAQVLLKGTPSIAHSFHYSPIKNRIDMLTNMNKSKRWKYLAVLPALGLCTIVMAKNNDSLERVTEGNITTFKGNKLRWVNLNAIETDTIIITDPVTGKNLTQIAERYKRAYIDQINKDTVFDNQSPLITPAQYRAQNKAFDAALNEVFKELNPKPSDTINEINIMNVVIDKQGKIAYYDLEYHCKSSGAKSIPYWDRKVDEALNRLPAWLPGLKDGKPVATFSDLPAAIRINPVQQQSWQVKVVSEKDQNKIEDNKQR